VLAVIAVAGLLSMSVVLSGCGMIAREAAEKTTEKAIENATGADVDIEGETVKIEGEGGSASLGEGAEIPSDFPDDVPVYEGTVKAAITGNDSWTISIETSDDAKTVLDFYTEKLEAEGWTKESSASTPDGGMYSAKKGERSVVVVATGGGGQTQGMTGVSLSVSKGQ